VLEFIAKSPPYLFDSLLYICFNDLQNDISLLFLLVFDASCNAKRNSDDDNNKSFYWIAGGHCVEAYKYLATECTNVYRVKGERKKSSRSSLC